MALEGNVDALAARIAAEFVAVREEIDENPRLPIALTQAEYDGLVGGPVSGQIYIIIG